MAACGSLQQIFKKPLPENPTLLESLSWNQIEPIEQDSSSFTELFGELHFKENPAESFPPSSPPTLPPSTTTKNDQITTADKNPSPDYFSPTKRKQFHNPIDSFSSMNPESLQLCTEGLGFESSADVEELKADVKTDIWEKKGENFLHDQINVGSGEVTRRARKSGGEFPPPISCIGESGKPWVWFKSYRQNGRFVLKEIRVPNQEFLHASREDGRLKLQFFQADGEDEEEEDEEEYDYDDDDEDERDGIDGEEEEEVEEMKGR